MKQEIKSKLEQYVLEQIDNLKQFDKSEDEFLGNEAAAIKNINVLVELLQKEDVNNNGHEINLKRLQLDDNKNNMANNLDKSKLEFDKLKEKNTNELEQAKLKVTEIKNNDEVRLKEEEIKLNLEINKKKIDVDINKFENDYKLKKEEIDNNSEFNKKKLESENNRYITEHDLELDKLDFEKKKLNDNLELENNKLNSCDYKNKEDVRLKEEEIKINNINNLKDVGLSILEISVKVIAVALPAIQYNAWLKKGFEFEEKGTFTSNTFKTIWSRFRPD